MEIALLRVKWKRWSWRQWTLIYTQGIGSLRAEIIESVIPVYLCLPPRRPALSPTLTTLPPAQTNHCAFPSTSVGTPFFVVVCKISVSLFFLVCSVSKDWNNLIKKRNKYCEQVYYRVKAFKKVVSLFFFKKQ